MTYKIRIDDLSSTEIADLLDEHLAEMKEHSPPNSIHALDLTSLKQANITFWSIWSGAELLGCGALKVLSLDSGEIKSMRVANQHQGKGIANVLLEHILKIAEHRNYKKLFLETGSMEGFARARSLYQKFGFAYCGPFGNYKEDPNSVYMSRVLS